jgi:hypothetical protein
MIRMVRIACEDAADLVGDHLQGFGLAIIEPRPTGLPSHGTLEFLDYQGVLVKVAMGAATLFEQRVGPVAHQVARPAAAWVYLSNILNT